MEIVVKRDPSAQGATLGTMSVDGSFECYTLEPEVREITGQPVSAWKIQNVTAIPRGRYRVIVDMSEHFGRELPHITNVPGFTGVRIHPGNKAADTEACTLVGQSKEGNLVYKSKAAFDVLFPKIEAAINGGQAVWYSVS